MTDIALLERERHSEAGAARIARTWSSRCDHVVSVFVDQTAVPRVPGEALGTVRQDAVARTRKFGLV